MKIIEIMSTDPRRIRSIDRLDAAARALWEQDCGMVPVVDADGALVGVVTDRDVCMGAYTQGRPLTEIPVTAVMARNVHTCRSDEAVGAVLATMQQAQVHRLPVVDARGALVGMISTNDFVRAAHARPAALEAGVVIRALATIGAPRRSPAAKVSAPSPSNGSRATAVVKPTSPAPAVDGTAKGKKAPKQAARSRSPKKGS